MKGSIRRRRSLLAWALFGLLAAPLQAEDAFRVIVNAANTGTQIKRSSLQTIFLQPAVRWPDGSRVAAVDQSTRSPVRAAFCDQVLGLALQAVQIHWMNNVRDGKGAPPPSKSSDAEVIAFVRSNPGAIGYVSAGAELDAGVKVIKIVE